MKKRKKQSKKQIIANYVKKRRRVWLPEIPKAVGASYITVYKWIKILELEGTVKVVKKWGMNYIIWDGDSDEV